LFAVDAIDKAFTHGAFFVPLGELDQALEVDEACAVSAAGAAAHELES